MTVTQLLRYRFGYPLWIAAGLILVIIFLFRAISTKQYRRYWPALVLSVVVCLHGLAGFLALFVCTDCIPNLWAMIFTINVIVSGVVLVGMVAALLCQAWRGQ